MVIKIAPVGKCAILAVGAIYNDGCRIYQLSCAPRTPLTYFFFFFFCWKGSDLFPPHLYALLNRGVLFTPYTGSSALPCCSPGNSLKGANSLYTHIYIRALLFINCLLFNFYFFLHYIAKHFLIDKLTLDFVSMKMKIF